MPKLDRALFWKGIFVFCLSLLGSAITKVLEILSSGNSVLGTIYFIGIIIVSAVFVQAFWLGIENLIKWTKTPNPKNLRLYAGKLNEHGVLDLVIHNKENRRAHATINAADAVHRAHDRKSRLSKISFELEKSKTRTVSFIRESKNSEFRIAEHFDSGGLEVKDSPPYTIGKSEFIIMIVFGFGGSQNEYMNCYHVIVNYERLHRLAVSIKSTECGVE